MFKVKSNCSIGSKSSKNKPTSDKKRSSKSSRRASIQAFLEQESSKSVSTPPLDEISLSSDMSGHSQGTELTMNLRSSRVSRISKMHHSRIGRNGSSRSLGGRQHSNRSFISHASSTCGSILNNNDNYLSGGIDHNHIITVTQVWEKAKLVENYKDDLVEQCILRMLELDPNTRTNLRLPSFRHA